MEGEANTVWVVGGSIVNKVLMRGWHERWVWKSPKFNSARLGSRVSWGETLHLQQQLEPESNVCAGYPSDFFFFNSWNYIPFPFLGNIYSVSTIQRQMLFCQDPTSLATVLWGWPLTQVWPVSLRIPGSKKMSFHSSEDKCDPEGWWKQHSSLCEKSLSKD